MTQSESKSIGSVHISDEVIERDMANCPRESTGVFFVLNELKLSRIRLREQEAELSKMRDTIKTAHETLAFIGGRDSCRCAICASK